MAAPVLTDNDIEKFDSQKALTDEDVQKSEQGNLSNKVIAQFMTGVAESFPGGKTITDNGKKLPSKLPLSEVPEPNTIPAKVAREVGRALPDIAMATPVLGLAGMIPGVGSSALATGVTGLGAYGAAKGAATQGPKGIIPGAAGGAVSGASYGVGGRLGATLMPKMIPGAERIGTAIVSAAIATILQKNENEKTADAIFAAGIGALSPVKGYDVKGAVASKLPFEVIGERLNKIPRESTRVIMDEGWDEVKRVGKMRQVEKDPNTGADQVKNAANIAKDYTRQGLKEAREINGDLYDKVEGMNFEVSKDQMKQVIQNMKEIKDSRIKDPSSPFHTVFNKALSSLLGVRQQALGDFKGDLSESEINDMIERSDYTNKTTIGGVNNIKKAMWDYVKAGNWKKPQNMSNEEATAKEIGDFLSNSIHLSNEGMKLADGEWRKMKDVEDDAFNLSSRDLSVNWKRLEPSLKNEQENQLNKIDSYFANKGLGKYQIKSMLEKYHAYNEWTNPAMGSLREQLPMRMMMGAGIGALVGGKAGAALGSAAVYKYGRPEAFTGLLAKVKPGSRGNKVDIEKAHETQTAFEVIKHFLGG